MSKEIDKVDKRILSMFSQNPEISQKKLSESLKITQPAVSARIRRLKETGVLTFGAGANIKTAQLHLARVDIVASETEHVIKFFNNCPHYLNSFLASGRYNLTILFVAENIGSIMSCADSHLRANPFVQDMEFNLIIAPVKDFIVPIRPILDKKKTAPCGADCSVCSSYANETCLGCPASIHYKGKLL